MGLTGVKSDDRTSTRDRLLETAGQVFADRGFSGATIREICHRAGANIASIHYHFGDKQKLYEAVIRHVVELWRKEWDGALPDDVHASPQERLLHFVRAFLHITDPPSSHWRAELLKHEIVESHSSLQLVVKEAMLTPFESVEAVIADLVGPSTDPVFRHLCMFSVVGQCLFYRHVDNRLLGHFGTGVEYTPATVDRLSRHITDFCLAAIEGLAQRAKNERPGRGGAEAY